VPFDQGAVLGIPGIPGITGHRAVLADGPVGGQFLLVTGAVGAVGRAAVAITRRAGATVIATVRHADQVDAARHAGAQHVLEGSRPPADLIAETIMITDGHRLDRIANLAFDANITAYVQMGAYHAVIATYAIGQPDPALPYWPMAFKNLTVRFLSNDDFPESANQQAATDLTAALAAGDLHYPIAARYPSNASPKPTRRRRASAVPDASSSTSGRHLHEHPSSPARPAPCPPPCCAASPPSLLQVLCKSQRRKRGKRERRAAIVASWPADHQGRSMRKGGVLGLLCPRPAGGGHWRHTHSVFDTSLG
jgi:NAD(P)-dependent dehydrogenase (short-subunit alcohol dehydrogenase family)